MQPKQEPKTNAWGMDDPNYYFELVKPASIPMIDPPTAMFKGSFFPRNLAIEILEPWNNAENKAY